MGSTQGYALERNKDKENGGGGGGNAVAWKIFGTHSGPPDKNTMETLEVLTSDGWKTFSWEDIFLRRKTESIEGTLKRLKEQLKAGEVEVQ